MTTAAAEEAAASPSSRLDRLYAAIPLLTAFVWLVALYAWQSWGHKGPWLFTDELELTQLSRGIAEDGQAAQRGDPSFFQTLYTYLIAPAWWIGDTSTAYGVLKYIGVFVMTSVVFPAYFLARTIVSPWPALFAAAGAAAIPALAYAPMIVEETLAYPYAALCFFLIAKALAVRGRGWIAGALIASAAAPLVRGELAVVPVVLGLAAIFYFFDSSTGRRWVRAWRAWDWVGAIVLATGVLVFFSAAVGHNSESWFTATGHYRGRMIEYGLWAAGAFTIGVGVLPVVAALAVLVRPKGEERTPALRAFTALFIAAAIGFGLYTAVKASYLSTVFATRILERNLIYLAPLVFVGTALWVERPRLRWPPLAAASGFAAYVIVTTPFALENVPYSDAFGLSIAQMANRNLAFADGGVQRALLITLAVAVVLLLAPLLLERRRAAATGLLAATAAAVLAWNISGQIAAATYSNDYSKFILGNFPHPPTWLDGVTGGQPAVYLGQNVDEGSALGIRLTEFWNRSLKDVWSLDGTAPGPGPVLTPDLVATDGRLSPDPRRPYAVVEQGIELAGTVVARPPRSGRWFVYRVRGPLRLAHAQTGIFADGWMSSASAYNRYTTPGDKAGSAVVTVSRAAWGGPDKPGRVVISVGTLVKGADRQPHIGKVTAVRRWVVHTKGRRRFVIPAPAAPFRVEVTVTPTFSPADYEDSSDRRELGAQVSYDFIAAGPGAKRRTRS